MGQSFSVIRQSLKRKREPESDDQNEPRKVLVVEGANEDVQSNSTTRRSTSTSTAAPTLPSSSEPCWDHDVFLSFRGEDTRKNFIDHLYSALVSVGILTFRDDEELRRGENISTELLNAIRGSRISIVVFSKSYASSRWCLDELVEIVHCKNTVGHTLFPIFYHVNTSDVRKQIGTFAEAFVRHEEKFQTDMEKVQRWRATLTEAANCSGWDLESVANGYESRFIKEIVEEVLCKVNPARLDVAKHPIGMESGVHQIKDLLNLGTLDVRIVGIYGMGGVGKTTLAKAVYNEIRVAFEGSSFLSNLKESSEKPNGLVHLQEQLLNDILKTNLKIGNVDRGINIIEERARGKKVLVILDDVDDFENLHVLCEKQWFGLGSRIIVTTRDEHLLSQLEVDEKYKVEVLNYWESLRLFSWHAFKMANPSADYSGLSSEAVHYAGGLPLALITLGSFLKGRSIADWKSKLKKLQRTPHDKIQKILKISFDSLEKSQQDIFLDIACFFVGMDKEYAIKIFDDCNFSLEIDIFILNERSLVTIDYQDKLKMHNLIRDMGREIVCEESPKYPGKRSRLWFHEDVVNVLHKRTGSETVEGLILNLSVLEDVHLKTEAFTNMKNLRLLQINSLLLTGSYEYLSEELKWLCWHKCPLKFLPQNFHLENLVILDMQHSNVKQVWKNKKILNKLKVLNLSNSKDLTRAPDFSQVPQLEILILEGCTCLVKVHESIGCLKKLVLLNFKNCMNLKDLPRSIFNLVSLESVDLSGCSALEKLPEAEGNIMDLMKLIRDETPIYQLPSSFGVLKNLKYLSLDGCSRLTELPNFLQAPHLERLGLKGCMSLVEIHESIGCLRRLVSLSLNNCMNLKDLPRSIFNLESLESFDLSGCLALEKLPEGNMMDLTKLIRDGTPIYQQPSSFGVLKNLKYLSLDGCSRLIELPNFLQAPHLETLRLQGCMGLVELHKSIGYLRRLVSLNLNNCTNLKDLPRSIFNLESLRFFDLSRCLALEKLPEGNMMDLMKLIRDETLIYQLPSSFGVLKNLEVLSLDGCSSLTELPNFLQAPHLERLGLKGCTGLVEIHESIGYLRRLVSLNLTDCTNLKDLPRSIFNLESLKTFDLCGCIALEKLPEQLGDMMDLTKLLMDETTSYQQPSSFGVLKNLEDLFFDGCSCLTELPNFLQAPHLRRLRLKDCTSLVEIHESIGLLKRLVQLDLERCKNLRNLPDNIVNLKSLKYLSLSCCLKLEKLPEKFGSLTALVDLRANQTAIKQLPISIGLLRNLEKIYLSGCGGPSSSLTSPKSSNRIRLLPSISGLCSLTYLNLSEQNLCEDDIPFEFGCLSSLIELDLSRNNFRNLPSCISCLPKLSRFCLNECIALQSISLPRSVVQFEAHGSTSLERILNLKNGKSKYFSLNNCHKLIEIQNLRSFESVIMGRCNNLAYDFKKSVLQAEAQYYGSCVCLPDIEIPNWFSHQTTGSLISFRVPSFFTGQISNLLLCVVYAANTEGPTDFDFMCTCRNKTRNPQNSLSLRSSLAYFDISEDHIFVDVTPFHRLGLEMKSGDEIEVSVEVMDFDWQQSEVKKREIQVKKCGIHLLFDDSNVGDGDIPESEDRGLYRWLPCLTKSRPQSPLPIIL